MGESDRGEEGRSSMEAAQLSGLPSWRERPEVAGVAWHEPVTVIDLDAWLEGWKGFRLPPWPVVGIGNPSHPLASRLDVLVEDASQSAQLVKAIRAQPLAAATLVHLLRMLPGLSVGDGLVAESLAYATLQGSAAHRAWIAGRRPTNGQQPPGSLELSRNGDEVAATLDRPVAGNAIDRPLRDALHEAFALVNLDSSITRITLRGRGKAFSLGADLAEFGTTTDPATAHMIRCRTLPAWEAARCAERFVAEVDGACVGAGLELAAFARHVRATRRSWFQLPELAMGILPGAGGCVSLTRRIGRQRTAFLALSGRRIGARQALEWGLIDSLVD